MINFSIINDWNNGFTANLSITNTGTEPINGWIIEFDALFEITNLWDGGIVSQNGDRYVIQNAAWNSTINPGQTISFGFNATKSNGMTIEPTNYQLNGVDMVDPNNPGDSGENDHNGDIDNHGDEHNHDHDPLSDDDPQDPLTDGGHNHDHGDNHGDEHNHDHDPLPDDDPQNPLTDGGQIFYSDGSNQSINNFDPSKDRVDIGPDSIHNQIPIDTAEGLVFKNMFNPNRSLTLVGINLKDLKAENFTPISDAHLQQDLSAALAWENGTGYIRENTVYIRSHQQGLEEIVQFNPETDRISFFYLSVRGDNQLNFAVEQTDLGVRFYSPITGQSITLSGIQFSDLDSSHFEWRANQLEDNIAGRMGLSDKIANFTIVFDNVFSGKSVAMAGLVDRAPYHTNYQDYTGTPIGSNPPPVDPVDPPIDPVDPPTDPVDPPTDPVDPPTDPVDPPTDPVDPPIDPVDPPIDPVDPPTDPVDPPTDPVDPPTDPVDPPTDPVDPPTDPVDPPDHPITSDYEVDFAITNDWGSGYQGEGKITNNDNSSLNGWTIEFEFSGNITQIWDGEIVSQNGDTYVIRNAGYNGTISAGQEISFGFLGNGYTSDLPEVFKLNGMVIGSNSDPIAPEDPGDPVAPENPIAPENPPTGDFNYGEALQKSLLFYEAQRSGPLPEDNRIEWRGDSAVNDGADVGVDLSGGYYDAGDHVKFGFPMASSMTMLSWGVVEYGDAYEQSGQIDEALEAIKWGTDYIIKAHITDNQGTVEFWGQVGNGFVDHSYWGPAEEMTMNRPSFKIDRQNPGSDLAGESAAALAAASIIFRESDSAYADLLLDNATQLFDFADQYRGKYSDAISNASSFYNSWSGYMDELSWSAAWLYKATGDSTYLDKAEQYYQGLNPQWTHNWDDKSYGAATLLAQATGKSEYQQDAEQWLDYWSDPNDGIQYTPGGLAWLDQWGSLRYSANTAFIAGVYSDTVNDYGDRYANFAKDQIDYILGDNPNNFSYMVGFGDDYALNPHHRSAHDGYNINDTNPNAHILYGALVGGPASPNDYDYLDVRSDYIRNEVALDYNAGLTGALVRLYDQFGGDPLTDSQINTLPGLSISDLQNDQI